jgi:hypothetical protein
VSQSTNGLRRRNYGNGHGYKIDGEKVPGVTTVLDAAIPKPFLQHWASRTVAEYAALHLEELWAMRAMGQRAIIEALKSRPNEVMVSAGARGTVIHGIAERMARGEVVDFRGRYQEGENLYRFQKRVGNVNQYPEDLVPWAQSVLDYMNEWQPDSLHRELPVGSRSHRYGGTIDDISDFPDGERRVVDYKTGRGVYSEGALQLGAYRNSEIWMEGDEERKVVDFGLSEEAYVVHIRPEGYQVYPVYVGAETLTAFARLKWVAALLEDDGPLDSWLGEPLPAPQQEGSSK